MPYYGQGDYYGQGGFFDVIKGVGKAALGFATGGPAGAIGSVAGSIRSALTRPTQSRQILPSIPLPGSLRLQGPIALDPRTGMPRRKRRRMQYTNQKALRRANRRVDGFVKEVKKSLKHTNYRLVSKSSRAGKSRGVITEAEAKRALRN